MTTVELPKSSQFAVHNTTNSDPIQSVEMLSVDDILNDLQQKTDFTNAQLNKYLQGILILSNNQKIDKSDVLQAFSQLPPEVKEIMPSLDPEELSSLLNNLSPEDREKLSQNISEALQSDTEEDSLGDLPPPPEYQFPGQEISPYEPGINGIDISEYTPGIDGIDGIDTPEDHAKYWEDFFNAH